MNKQRSPEQGQLIDTHEVFRQLILGEIRNGRLSRWRRRRIVQYAAAMGLSATEAGDLLVACRKEVLQSPYEQERIFALKTDPKPINLSWVAPLLLVIAILAVWLMPK